MSRSRQVRAHWSRKLLALTLPLWLAMGSWAVDAHAGARILLLEFAGRNKPEVLREKVAKSLEEAGNTVVLAERTSAGASKTELRNLAQGSNADALVDGRVLRQNMRLWTVSLRVLDADTGKKVGQEVRFKNSWLPGLSKDLLDDAGTRLAKSIRRAQGSGSKIRSDVDSSDDGNLDGSAPAEPETDEPEAASDEESVPPEAEKTADNLFVSKAGEIADEPTSEGDEAASHMIAALSARAGFVHRTFDFSDDLYDRLRKQDANIWVYQVQGEVYPFEEPVGDHLGLIARYEGVISGNVKDADFGGSFSVNYQEMYAGARARYPLGRNMIGFDLTFGRMRAGLEDPSHRTLFPEVSYTMLRSSLDGSFVIGPLNASVSVGFRLPLGYGEIKESDWFPRVGGYGVEATGGLEYPVSKLVSLDLTGSVRRYLLEMNSEPKDAMGGVSEVAGGAVDLYLAAYFGLTFRL